MMKRNLVLVIAVAAALAICGSAAANDLQRSLTIGSTDFAAFGDSGLRGVGTGQFAVTGITGSVQSAYMYWHGPTDSTDPNVDRVVTFDGTNVTGSNIGFSDNNCWGFTNSQAYRADVTSLVSGNGTYPFSFPGFSSGSVELNGASLLIFYNDGNPANNVDVAVFDGNDSNIDNPYDSAGWNATLGGITYTSGTANMLMVVSDGQTFADTETVLINGVTLIAPGNNFQGDTLPSEGGCPNGCLWDHRTEDVTSFLNPGPNTLTLTTSGSASDCLSLIALAFVLPAGAIEPVEVRIPTLAPAGLALMVVLLLGCGVFVLRRLRG